MRGNIEVNGKKMTVIELAEAYLEVLNDLETANSLLEAKKERVQVLENSLHDLEQVNSSITTDYYRVFEKCQELEQELRVKEDLPRIKNAISNAIFKEPSEEHSERPGIEWCECEMTKCVEDMRKLKELAQDLTITLHLLKICLTNHVKNEI